MILIKLGIQISLLCLLLSCGGGGADETSQTNTMTEEEGNGETNDELPTGEDVTFVPDDGVIDVPASDNVTSIPEDEEVILLPEGIDTVGLPDDINIITLPGNDNIILLPPGDDDTVELEDGTKLGVSIIDNDSDNETGNDDEIKTTTLPFVIRGPSKWDKNRIKVCWENSGPSTLAGEEWVKEAVNETWQKHSALEFYGWARCENDGEDIRILIEDSGPLANALGKNLQNLRNGMVLNFTFNNWSDVCQNGGDVPQGFRSPRRIAALSELEYCIKAIAVHEFGHGIGLIHEQGRTEDDGFQNCRDQGSAFDAEQDVLVSSYDLFSIMNYCHPTWNGGGLLSAADIFGAVTIYGSNPENAIGANEADDRFGHSIASGDMNQDGITDLFIGAPGEAPGADPKSGFGFIYNGSFGGLRPAQGIDQTGMGANEAGDQFGYSAATGDFNNDGFSDLAVGAPTESPSDDPKSGMVFVFKGGSEGVSRLTGIDQSRTPMGVNQISERFGRTLHAGEFTGDDFDDLLVGSYGAINSNGVASGAVFLFDGRSNGISSVAKAFFPESGQRSEQFGVSIASGDFDGDGVTDVAIGSPGHNQSAGKVTIYAGSSSGLQSGSALYQDGLGANEAGDRFGTSLATGDFNRDGFDDLAVGAPLEKPGDFPQSGYVFIFNGSRDGLQPGMGIDQQKMGANERGDNFGYSLHANDFDGDGFDDLAIGAPFESPGGDPESGYVFLQRGTTGGLEPWIGIDQHVFGDNEDGDRFGHTMTSGDYDNDGIVDLVIGAYGDKGYGRVYVFNYRAISTLPAATPQFLHWYHFDQSY